MSLRDGDAVVEFDDVICKRATDKALLVDIKGEELWIPMSQISDDSEVYDDETNSRGKLVISEWICKQKNLI